MGSCVARPDVQRPESSAALDHNGDRSQTPQGRQQPPERAVRSPEVDALIVPDAVAVSPRGASTEKQRLPINSAEDVVVAASTISRDVVARERENELEHSATPLPSSSSPLPTMAVAPAERTSHASTWTLTEETSHTRPDSLAAQAGESIAAEVSYDTNSATLEESAKFSSIPLIPNESE